MSDFRDLIPNYDKMIVHKCLHCGEIILNMPGRVQALYCLSNGKIHTDNEPYMLMVFPKDLKQSVTFFNYDGTKSRKGWVTFDDC